MGRGFEVKSIYTDKNEILEHRHFIFYSEFVFKGLHSSEHILINCTYAFPPGFSQTLIIMYYDIIVNKFIPGIYVL